VAGVQRSKEYSPPATAAKPILFKNNNLPSA